MYVSVFCACVNGIRQLSPKAFDGGRDQASSRPTSYHRSGAVSMCKWMPNKIYLFVTSFPWHKYISVLNLRFLLAVLLWLLYLPIEFTRALQWSVALEIRSFRLDHGINLDALTPSLIKPWPNTYTFTKALAEWLLLQERGSLPCCIFRPSIIVASAEEPIKVCSLHPVWAIMQLVSVMLSIWGTFVYEILTYISTFT